MRPAKHWTPAADALLRDLWLNVEPLGRIATRLGRSPSACYQRARTALRLPLVPQGFERLTHAARRMGYAVAQLRQILAADGASLRRALVNPRYHSRHAFVLVEILEVNAAVAAWEAREPATRAARRLGLGLSEWTVRARLRRAGVTTARPHARIRVTDAQLRAACEGA